MSTTSPTPADSQSHFFWTPRFFPLFWVQFLGAFNDNLFKTALVMLITFRLAESVSEAALLVTLAAGIFILPFLIFSAFAGQIADKVEKSWLIRKIKLAEILIMLFGAMALITHEVNLMLAVLFLMGAQSAFFGPVKYAILPEHLSEEELTQGNGWFSASTFVAILFGTIAGGWVVLTDTAEAWVAFAIVLISIKGYVLSRWIPVAKTGDPTVTVQWNIALSTWQEVNRGRAFSQAFFAVLFISWFWFLGATYLSQMPILVKELLHSNEQVVVLFLATFSFGIGLGAWLVSRFTKGLNSIAQLRWQIWLLVGMSVAIIISNLFLNQLQGMSLHAAAANEPLMTIVQFSEHFSGMVVLFALLVVSTLGGMFIVPLYTVLQLQTPADQRARMIGVNNITNALFMVVSSIWIMLMYALQLDLIAILYGLALLNLAVGLWYLRRSTRLAKQST